MKRTASSARAYRRDRRSASRSAVASTALAQGRGGGGPPGGGGPGVGGLGGGGMGGRSAEWAARSFPDGGPADESRPDGNNLSRGPGREVRLARMMPRPGLQLGPPGQRWWDDKSMVKSLKLRPDQQAHMDAIFEQNRNALLARLRGVQQAESQMAEISPSRRRPTSPRCLRRSIASPRRAPNWRRQHAHAAPDSQRDGRRPDQAAGESDRSDSVSSQPQLADVDAERRQRHRVQVLRAHCLVGCAAASAGRSRAG